MRAANAKGVAKKRSRRTNVLRYEDAVEPEEVSREKAVPKDLARTGKTFSITDNWRAVKEPTRDLGFWWTGRTEFLLENGEYRTVQHDIPRKELYTVGTLDTEFGWQGKRTTVMTPIRDKNMLRRVEVALRYFRKCSGSFSGPFDQPSL